MQTFIWFEWRAVKLLIQMFINKFIGPNWYNEKWLIAYFCLLWITQQSCPNENRFCKINTKSAFLFQNTSGRKWTAKECDTMQLTAFQWITHIFALSGSQHHPSHPHITTLSLLPTATSSTIILIWYNEKRNNRFDEKKVVLWTQQTFKQADAVSMPYKTKHPVRIL